MERINTLPQNVVGEWPFRSSKTYKDPFNEIELDIVFVDEQRKEKSR